MPKRSRQYTGFKTVRTRKRRTKRKTARKDENTFKRKYNVNAVSQRHSKRSFRGPVKHKSKFASKVTRALAEHDYTVPIKVRQFGPYQLTAGIEKVKYGVFVRPADYPSKDNVYNKAKSNWSVMQVDPADGITKAYNMDPYEVAGSDVKFKYGQKWRLRLKNNLTAGAEVTFYLVKAKCQSSGAHGFIDELLDAYKAKYPGVTNSSALRTDHWVSPTSGIFPKGYKRNFQIMWSTSVSMETGQECMINVPYYELIYHHDQWTRDATNVAADQLAGSYLLYYRLEGKVSSSSDLETSQFAGTAILGGSHPATNDIKAVGTNACEIDMLWDYVESYSWDQSKKNNTSNRTVANYDDDVTMSTDIVEANHVDGVGE